MTLRTRLTLWYGAVVALVLIAFGGICYALLARGIHSATDASLADASRTLANTFAVDPAGVRQALSLSGQAKSFSYTSDREFLVVTNGRIVASSPPRLTPEERARVAAAAGQGFATVAGGVDRDGVRLYSTPVGAYRIVVACDLDEQADRLESAAQFALFAIPLALLIASGGGSLLARRMERTYELQRRFMADASHELRTPLAIIQGEVDVALARDRDANEYRESLETVRGATQKLTQLVQNLFLIARGDAGSYPIARTSFYLEELINDCVRSMRNVAAAREIELVASVATDMQLDADEALIGRMLLNLIDNAIKFTPAGGRVEVSAARDGDAYIVRVRDTGCGISPAEQPHVFERFYRVDRARSSAGAGLGLPIARWIAEAHGGTVEIEKSDGEGSVFRVALRLP
ncbi:MAG TPA: HAMP domain-containing sensor histidine kinase [Thermoanaerobaculia bacterium]|nr:HAMP domain-containing sensor histidine kinase [Thermoanaerobaculia bacterium]